MNNWVPKITNKHSLSFLQKKLNNTFKKHIDSDLINTYFSILFMVTHCYQNGILKSLGS